MDVIKSLKKIVFYSIIHLKTEFKIMCSDKKLKIGLLKQALEKVSDEKVKSNIQKIIDSDWSEKKLDKKTLESYRNAAKK